MSLTADRYGKRHNGNAHGDVFTLPEVVRFMLDLIGYSPDKDLSRYTILEPSCGLGEFLVEIQERIVVSSEKFGFDAETVIKNNVYACEIDKSKLSYCISRLSEKMPGFQSDNFRAIDFLTSEWPCDFDFIVGNPPYVRYENIPESDRDRYKSKFKTFHYRCDLYVLFFEHALSMLRHGGRHCFICSNRWLKNEYGKKLRSLISRSYDFEYLIDVENLNAFAEDVLAYPAITVVSYLPNKRVVKTARFDNLDDLNSPTVYTDRHYSANGDWSEIYSKENYNRFQTIVEQGFTIGIGVATGADKIFVSRMFPGKIESELLLPLINARDLQNDNMDWNGRYILNPYDNSGRLIDIDLFPQAKMYLESHKNKLCDRHIVKNNRVWYALIDKIKPSLLSQPKILLPDISGNKVIFVDEGRFYPAHNIYYITGKSLEDLKLLAAILMSEFSRNQISEISNKMNGGFPRWQSQALRKLRIPEIGLIPDHVRIEMLDAYSNRDLSRINSLMTEVINSQNNNRICGVKRNAPYQLSLFGQFSA